MIQSRLTTRRRRWAGALALALLGAASTSAADPFIDEVVSFTPGTGAGFGVSQMPGIVLGPPRGAGAIEGSLDVVSLGNGGTIVVAFRDNTVCDGAGPDFVIFENAFHAGAPDGPVFTEVGIVAVSEDGQRFVELPYDPETLVGLAGLTPVLSRPDNGLDPTDPAIAGGDSFDLATAGLARITYIRITDPGAAIADVGNRVPSVDQAGFDLDAVAAIHSCSDGAPTTTPTATVPAPTATATATATTTATRCAAGPPGDGDGNCVVDAGDVDHCMAELFDGDGDRADAAAGGTIRSAPGVDANADDKISAADCVGTLQAIGTATP